jgi:PAS domain S-box-containing protein
VATAEGETPKTLERLAPDSEWQSTFDAICDCVFVIDHDGAVTRANRAATNALARASGEIVGKRWVELMCLALPGLDDTSLDEAVQRRERVVMEMKTNPYWLRVTVDPLPDRAGVPGGMVCVVSDITQRKQSEMERVALLTAAERARAIAESAYAAKSEFLATMSHEIRTPINAILGYAQLLDMGIAGSVSEEQRAQIDRLRRSAAHLLRLVNEVFDLATVDAGRMRVEREQVAVDEVIEDALAICRPLAQTRGITIVGDGQARRILFVGDVGRVRQILVNLLSNAVKFSSPGDQISIHSELAYPPAQSILDSERKYLAISVRDEGIGMSGEQMLELFEPFVQGETGRTRAWGGSGLGLAISRRLARLMAGDITVTSELGKGSSFTLWLPPSDDQSLVSTTEQPSTARRTAPFDPLMFAEIGRTLAKDALGIGHAIVARIRTSDVLPPAGALGDAQLVDHIPAYVVDLGLALVIVSEVGVEASGLLHDGNAIRSEIAERHGAQRRRIGWSIRHVELEYDLLLEELDRLLRARSTAGEAQLDGAIELISRLVAQSRVASVRGHREAGETED